MLTLICSNCGKSFERSKKSVYISQRRGDKHQFCSRKCGGEFIQTPLIKKVCDCCGIEFKRKREKTSKSGKYFCSRKCASELNSKIRSQSGLNKSYAYSKGRKIVCIECGEEFILKTRATRKKCYDCSEKFAKRSSRITIGELSNGRTDRIGNFSRRASIQKHARSVVSDEPLICEITGYTRHAVAAHIIPVARFKMNTPLKVVNDRRNIVLLSPTPHWELDHGFLKPKDLPKYESFKEYEQEAKAADYLK